MADAFDNSAAWCTKATWPKWHFYINGAMPLCGRLEWNPLDSDEDLMIAKCHPDSGACEVCVRQGERAGLWHAASMPPLTEEGRAAPPL
jgi:hypothetical protein